MQHYFKINPQEWDTLKQQSEKQELSLQTVFFSVFLEALYIFRDITDNEFVIDISYNKTLKTIEINEDIISLNKWAKTCSNIQELINSNSCEAATASQYLFEFNQAATETLSDTNYTLIFRLEEKEIEGEITLEISKNSVEYQNSSQIISAIKKNINWVLEGNWSEKKVDFLTSTQRQTRNRVNDTFIEVPEKLLHEDFFVQASKNPDQIALYWIEDGNKKVLTYGALAEKSLKLAAYLLKAGLERGELVAITLPKGVEQVISVLGILAAGGAYLPISIDQPIDRQNIIRNIAEVKHIIVESIHKEDSGIYDFISLDQVEYTKPLTKPVENKTDASAYVIFTSGSTGEPKGVEIAHKAAYNTICDLNNKYNVNSADKILAISALDFDLSVYDIFGPLARGAGIVLIEENQRKEASVWCKLVQEYQITLWNTVPALLDMLLLGADQNTNLSSIRLVFVSGDWVGLDLSKRLKIKTPDCQFIAMGGATEASIWSNYFEVDEIKLEWNSIPYGKPLGNQKYRVVNIWGSDCSEMVSGELWIGGKGVAKGYLKRPELTQKSFVTVANEIWYRTGDIGRYWSDGNIEFLGRKDQQVKVRGYRIELGEIETALKKYNGVFQSVATVVKSVDSQHLVAGVVGEKGTVSNYEPSEDLQLNHKNINPIQDAIIINFLIQLLEFDKINPNENWNPSQLQNITAEMLPVVNMWANWLVNKKILSKTAIGFTITSKVEKYKEILFKKERESKASKNLEFVHTNLINSLDIYKSILTGTLSEVELLNLEGITPEYLSTIDSGTITGIQKLAEKINVLVKSTNEVINVGIFGGRTGLLVQQLLQQIAIKSVRFTVFDNSVSLLEKANKKLKKTGHIVNCIRVAETEIPEAYKYQFDVVLGINVFHRYKNVNQGLDTALLMLKNDGLFMGLEHYALAPIALVTSAVLDKAFINFDIERKRKVSPMLTGEQWKESMTKSGFIAPGFTEIKETYTNYLEAKAPLERPLLLIEDIMESLKAHLPVHMLPEKILVLPFIPLSANGKVDKKTFATQFEFFRSQTIEEPQEGMETEIADVWKTLLQIDKIGREQVFFQIGGDSLSATRFLSVIKEKFKVELSLREIFESRLKDIAITLENKVNEQALETELMEQGEI